ncbi:MAG TPA: sorbosone dehydrogenase family protein [Gemmatimonadaceae bacterium]|nr:sorbosone dehydrogenase family protein [Gemmatimonadaceae bacterium]
MRIREVLPLLAAAVIGMGCGGTARVPVNETIGANPRITAPDKSMLPVMQVPAARGWSDTAKPRAVERTQVQAFAKGLEHPRWLYVLPNGDVLVAESTAPPKPPGAKDKTMTGIRGWFAKKEFKKAGAAVPSANRITLLRDKDGDGVAEERSTFLDSLTSPFGMVLVGDELYIANADAIVHVPYRTGELAIAGRPTKLIDLPAGLNHHWTKNVIASADGSKLYVTVGSNSNAGENGMAVEEGRASIWEVDRASGSHRIFASGLRNPNGMVWEPTTGALWTVVNERDELGSDLVPDYLTSVKDGGFYGWPYSYFGKHIDKRVKPQRPDFVATAIMPDYALSSHVAPLGLALADSSVSMPSFRSGMFVGMHGSWNRKPLNGYKVVYVPFVNGKPSGLPVDVLTGFLSPGGDAYGRPVGVVVDKHGALLVADDVGNTVWRVGGAERQVVGR